MLNLGDVQGLLNNGDKLVLMDQLTLMSINGQMILLQQGIKESSILSPCQCMCIYSIISVHRVAHEYSMGW